MHAKTKAEGAELLGFKAGAADDDYEFVERRGGRGGRGGRGRGDRDRAQTGGDRGAQRGGRGGGRKGGKLVVDDNEFPAL